LSEKILVLPNLKSVATSRASTTNTQLMSSGKVYSIYRPLKTQFGAYSSSFL